MSMFTKSELEFLKLLENDKFFVTESSDKDRRKVLDKTVSILRDLGYDPKISKKSEDKWIATNNSGDLGGESLCISIGQLKGLSKVCSAVNKEIKPQAKLSPDNYGTVFLTMKESVVTESYLGNYIRNKIYLSKMGKNPDLNRRTIISFIKKMETHYESSLLDEEVKDLMTKRNVGDYYLPKGSMTFPDGKEITFAFCYDKSSFTPGAAMKTEDGSYVILLYPKFFECEDMEDKIFTVMHEIGHVRLGHLEHRNQSIDMDRREHQMIKGRAIYPELNADLYAVLNGAKMYTILSYTDARDYNKKYDYRYSNNEIALRYGFVFKNYKKYRNMYESAMTEGVILNDKDIYYNKEKFNSGEINICFITGHSGSGKSTMAENMTDKKTEHYDLDDVVWNKERFTMDQFKEYGDLIYSFFKGPGKKYYYTAEDIKSGKVEAIGDSYEKNLITDFIEYAIAYAKSHKNTKFVIEGIWIYLFAEPSKLDKCAVFIKGTSATISAIRAAKRDSKNNFPDNKDYIKRTKCFMSRFGRLVKGGVGTEDSGIAHERFVKNFRNHFENITITESGTLTSITGEFNVEEVYFSKYNDKDYAYVKVEGDDRPLRGRSEVIIMKDDEIFLCFKDNGKYRLPGGGWDKLESYEHAAIREAKEEARILCDDVEYAICRVDWEDKVPDKCFKENIPEEGYWYGWFTKVYVARYSGKYNGHIDKEDQDKDMASNGKFYKYSEVKDILYPDHKIAIEKYLQSSLNVMEKTDSKNDDPKQKMLDDFKHYVKWCTMDDGSFMAIRPLENYMIHNSKKQGDMLLLATLCSLPKDKVKHILECLHNNVSFNDERVDFHTCYLPGDVFIYILLSDVKKESVEEFYEEFCIEDPFDEVDEFYLEASDDSNTHIILEEIYPNIEEILSTREGDKLFKRYVEEFVDRNTEKLHEPCPISMIAFTDYDKAKFYQLFKFEEKELIKIVTKAVNAVSSSAQFKLVKQNPIFSVFYCVLRYYILKNDAAGINTTLIIHALASYPSVFSKYFKYGANPGVMKYTADHLTEKFIFKQEKHVFGALKKSIDSAYKFLKPYFKEAPDKEIIRYIQRIRNDQNSMIKKIAIEYNKNYNAGKTVSTQSETYDTGALIDEYNNDTSKVETLAQKVVINILTNGIDLRILETAGAMAQLSVTELRLYLTKILIDSRSTELEEFVNSVLFIYLFDEKHETHEIRSRVFLSFGIELFRKTNSNNKNIVTIKSTLDKWAEETGIHSRYRREPTRISYKKGIYWYILLTIQMNV